jgi:parallel beta-helix repeat protein
VDGDEFYGEAPSTAPPGYSEEMFQEGYGEVFVGRIPTDNTDMIRYWVDKLITYEKNPGRGDYSYLESVLSIQADDPQTFDHGRRMQEWLPMTWEKHIIEEDGGGFCCESSYPEGHHVSDSINAVHPHYITDHSHGSINAIQIMAQGQACKPEAYIACGFDTCLSNHFYGYIPAPGKYDFFDIDEGPYYSIMNVAACNTGDFAVAEYDPDFIQCFGALFLFVPDRGGVAYVGDTKTGYWVPQFMGMEHFINVGFLGDYMDYGNRLGPAFDASRAMVEVPFHSLDMDLRRHKYYLNYTLLGDPEMPIWGGQPDHFRVDVIRLDNFADTVRVMKSNGSPVSGAYVCVNFNDTAYYVNFTGESGIFVLPEPIHDLDGSELITITARNMIPCQIYGDKELTDNTLWTGDVTVLDSVLVSEDARLTIHPGSRIRFKRNAFLRVYGEIEAVDESGLPEREIIFTADTTGAVPHDFWMGIHICYGASVHFQNCRVSYGDYGLYVNRAIDCSVKHCSLSNNNYHGLFIRGRSLHPGWIEGCHLDSNTICGIKAYGFNVFIADTMINNGIFGYYRFTSGGDSLADCVVEYDGDDYDITRWGMYIEFRGSAQVTKHVAVTGGRVTGYKQGGIKVLRADSESIIGGGINLDDNGIYGLYLENTDISVLGGTEPISCNRIIGNRYGLYSYNGTGIYRLNYFDNDSVNVWVRPIGIYGRLPVVSDYNTFQQAKVLVKNYSYSTLNATRNYWPDQQGSILGPVDTSYSLAFDPCSQSKIAGLDQIPAVYALHQNYPNPFNPTTVMEYDLPRDSQVKITIYNILGQKVKVLVDEYQAAGYRAVQWDGCNDYGLEVSTGVYFYLMEAGKYRSAKKMLMLK